MSLSGELKLEAQADSERDCGPQQTSESGHCMVKLGTGGQFKQAGVNNNKSSLCQPSAAEGLLLSDLIRVAVCFLD